MTRTITGRPHAARAAPIALLALFIPITSLANSLTIAPSATAESSAFARYIASIQDRSPFTESGPVGVEIEASLPGLYKQSRLLAIRQTDHSEHTQYRVVQMQGDGIVMQAVVAQYLKLAEKVDDLPFSSVAITPANYRFRYKGRIGNENASALVFEIIPKKKRDGLIQGQLWIDSATGAEVLQRGYLVKTPSTFVGPIKVVRDTKLLDGHPCLRVTHVTVETRAAGRGELTITELPIVMGGDELERDGDTPERPVVSIPGWTAGYGGIY